jgi:hypothetical protein
MSDMLCTICKKVKVRHLYCEKCRKDYWKTYLKVYRKNNKAKISNLNEEWRKSNKEYCAEYKVLYYRSLKGRLVELLRSAKRRAKKRSLNFNLTLEFLEALWAVQNDRCAVTGLILNIPQTTNNGKAQPFSPSIDRIDPAKGYTEGNVRIVCYVVNCALHFGINVFSVISRAYLNGIIPSEMPCRNDDAALPKDKNYREGPKGVISALYNQCRKNAKAKNIEFKITKKFIAKLFVKQKNKCILTSITFSNLLVGNKQSNPFRASIDRVNPKIGYVPKNIRLVIVAMNYAMNEFGENIFKEICEAYENNLLKPSS